MIEIAPSLAGGAAAAIVTIGLRHWLISSSHKRRVRRRFSLLKDALLHSVIENAVRAERELLGANKEIKNIPIDYDTALWRTVSTQFVEVSEDAEITIRFSQFFSYVDSALRLKTLYQAEETMLFQDGAVAMAAASRTDHYERQIRQVQRRILQFGWSIVDEFGTDTHKEAFPDVPEQLFVLER